MNLINKLLRFLIVLFIFSSIVYSQKVKTEIILQQNYSNPFNPSTQIGYSLVEGGYVSLKIYDSIGREVKVLVDRWEEPGIYFVTLSGNNISSGIYFLNLRTGGSSVTKKIVCLK